jgi:mono/diheme cytochrome c family protein
MTIDTSDDARGMARWMTIRVALLGLLIAAGGGIVACSRSEPQTVSAVVSQAETPPEHTDDQRLFDLHCAPCHGPGGTGTGRGPSFLSKIYEPGHHADVSFLMAVRRGVAAHHWSFGNMPPISGVTEADAIRIIGYIRWLQRQAGIV